MYFIGIDLGTSAVKLLLTDEKANVIKTVSKEYKLSMPKKGWSEQNPKDWYEKSVEGVKELLDGVDKSEVKGISFGGQMHGLVALDKYDNIIRPAILWNDGRTRAETEYLNEDHVGKDFLLRHAGNIAFAGFTAPKLLWMQKNEKENYEKIDKIMLPKDYLAYMFTGVHATDPSDASGTLLYNVQKRRWSKDMLRVCKVKLSWLPTVYESYEKIGNLKEEVAKEFGVGDSVSVIIGAGDNAAAAIGMGTVEEGACNISLGTSGTVFIATDNFVEGVGDKIHSFAHANGKYHLMGCILSAASCNKWWREEVLKTDYKDEDYDNLGENEVFFLPYLMGERSPHNDEAVRGAFMGLSLSTERKDMSLAIYEGVAFAIKDCVEIAKKHGIKIEESTVCGGGAKNKLWLKILANVLNITVKTKVSEQGPGLGSAMLAIKGCGLKLTPSEDVGETVVPQKELVAKYEKMYKKYVKLYPAIKGALE